MSAILAGYFASATIFTLCSLLLYLSLVYPFLLSPLAKIPNAHWTSPFVPWWILWKRYRRQELLAANGAHQRLGPIVRLGPKDLSVSCYEDGIRKIYGGGFDKPNYYDFFNYYGRPNSFCSLTKNDHSVHRRRISAVYTKSALFGSPQLASLTEKVLLGRLVPKLREQASSHRPTELLEMTYSLCLDYISAFLFGYSSGSNFLQDESNARLWLEHYEQRFCKESFWPQELPKATQMLKSVGIDMLPKEHLPSKQYLERWMMGLCDKADAAHLRADQGNVKDPAETPVVYQKVKEAVEVNLKGADFQTKKLEIASELFDHMSAAREVLGLVLSFTIYYISQNQPAQERLRSEIRSASLSAVVPDNRDEQNPTLLSPRSLDRLPFLSAVLKESFRMRPNSTPLPRITPHDRSVSLAGVHDIPPGTRVNAFQWFVHRDSRQWDQPDSWMPERWLHGEDVEGKGDEGVLWAFGSGPRMCVGTHLTQYMMRYVIAVIFSNFSLVAINDGSFGRHPPGSPNDRLMVKFEPLSS